ncbi:3-hydroxyisobutyrate dehydrogenase [Rhizobiaceae bacterium]|nr:3-hydroxyisobutyrate dehydrogenase [Rhizobiaceae bacterium]
MAMRLLGADFPLAVWNRSPERAAPLAAAGARLAAAPGEAAADSDVVISVLFDDTAVSDVVFGKDGLAEAMRPGAIHLSCSTISPPLADRLEEEHGRRGQHAVSAPLLGSAAMAAAGTLYLATSGPAQAIERLAAVFAALAQKTLVVGERPRHAVVAKLANNFLLFAVTEAIGEALALAEKSGLPRAAMMDLMWETDFGKRIFAVYGRKVLDRAFEPATAPARLAMKDLDLALAQGAASGASMAAAGLLRERLAETIARGWGELEFAAVSLLTDAESGLPVPHGRLSTKGSR